jgi:hypothetical protein
MDDRIVKDGRDKPREVRLFVSSTFVDMQHEREALVKQVFPEIKAFCEARGISFAPVRGYRANLTFFFPSVFFSSTDFVDWATD